MMKVVCIKDYSNVTSYPTISFKKTYWVLKITKGGYLIKNNYGEGKVYPAQYFSVVI